MPTINKPQKKRVYKKNPKNQVIATIYANSIWRNLRNSYLMDHPLCECCLHNGITKPAEEVHHVIYISSGKDENEMKDIAFNKDNLIALCGDCHHKAHNNPKIKNLINNIHYEKSIQQN